MQVMQTLLVILRYYDGSWNKTKWIPPNRACNCIVLSGMHEVCRGREHLWE